MSLIASHTPPKAVWLPRGSAVTVKWVPAGTGAPSSLRTSLGVRTPASKESNSRPSMPVGIIKAHPRFASPAAQADTSEVTSMLIRPVPVVALYDVEALEVVCALVPNTIPGPSTTLFQVTSSPPPT